jgi:hypothetical protein
MASRSQINDEVVTVLSFGNLRIVNIIGNGQALTGLNGSNIVGTVANANYAAFAGDVVNAAQPNITSLGTLVNLAVSGNVVAGNVNAGNTLTANFVTGTLTTSAQPNVTSLGTLTGLTVNGISNLGSNANVKITGGAVGQVLGTDGTGNLSWITGAGSPGGANTAVQYNDAGTFGGSSFFTFNELTNNVNIAGNLIANSVSMGAGVYEFSRSYVYFATTNSTSEQVLLSIPATGMAAVDYTIISDDGSIRNFIKISAVRSGTTVNYVEYSTLPVNGYTGDFVVAYDAGNILNPASIQLRMTPQSANLMTHKMMVTTYKE